MNKPIYLILIISFLGGQNGFSQIVSPIPEKLIDSQAKTQPTHVTGQWYNEILDELNSLYELDQNAPDTNNLKRVILSSQDKIELYQQEYNTMPEGLSIRYLYDLKMEIAGLRNKIDKSAKTINTHFKNVARKRITFINTRKILFEFLYQKDSSFGKFYNQEYTFLSNQVDEGLAFLNSRVENYAIYKDEFMVLINQASQLYSTIGRELSQREARLFRSELPPIWKSGPSNYHAGFVPTLAKTAQRTFETFKSYVASSLVSIILFRILLYLLFLLPIYFYFKNPMYASQRIRINDAAPDAEIQYFDDKPIIVSIIMGLALSPIIFVNAPHSFLELIFISLVFAVCLFTFKNYPKVDKNLILWIFVPYLLLYLLNFFITPTFLSRIIWSFCILLIIPHFLFLRRLREFNLRYEGFIRFLVIFLMLHIPVGWVWIIIGRYTLGKSVVLAAYNMLILAVIFRIALFSFLDYLAIVSTMINMKSRIIHINYKEFARIILPFLYFFIFISLIASYLANLNMYEFTSQAIQGFLEQPRFINDVEFDYKSILLFLASVYLAFLVSNLLRATFDHSREQGSEAKKNKFSSYVILFRLLIISAGFFIAILISGIPLNTFAIIFGALSLGIGFGLQSMVANIFSGLFIAFERPFVVGDFVEYGKESGRVKEIGLRATRILTGDGADVLIPNGALLSNNIKNWTYSDNHKAIDIEIPVDHSEDHMKIQSLITDALKHQAGIIYKPASIVLSEIREYSTVFKVTLTIDNLSNASKVKGEFMNSLYTLFKDNDVKLPEPNLKDFQLRNTQPST